MPESEEPEELESGVKGKQGELIVIGELLIKGWKVYSPLVDLGIDCLVDVGNGNYKEIQIKYREDNPVFTARSFRPRPNFYVICYLSTRHRNHFWVVPSQEFYNLGGHTRSSGREYIQLSIREGSENYRRLAAYHDSFDALLIGASKEVRHVVQQASQRIAEPHFKQGDFERALLAMLASETRPLGRKEMIERLYADLHDRFSPADSVILKSKGPRWERTARWAITNLNARGLVEAKSRNQWTITGKGRAELSEVS